jgi:hypothetical protein
MKDPTLAGTRLDQYFHVCSFFNSRDEEYDVLTPFYREEFEGGENMLHIVAPQNKNDHLERLTAKGVNAQQCVDCGQLTVLGWEDAYLNEGRFDQDRMLTAVQSLLDASKKAGFPRMRIMGNMNWALSGPIPGSEQVIEYEARVNEVLTRNRQPAVCVYDIALLSATMMMDILRTHPLTLIGGVVHRNPFYLPPEQIIPQLKARRREQSAQLH